MNFRKPYIAALHDITMASLSFVLSLYLRLGDDFFAASQAFLVPGLLLFTAICSIIFYTTGLYRGVWRYASLQDLLALTKAATLAILIFIPIMFLVNRLEGFPRSALLINWFVLLALLGGPRFLYRMLKERTLHLSFNKSENSTQIPVLLVGLDDHSELFLRNISGKNSLDYKVVGIVDDDITKVGREIRNIKIYSTIGNVQNALRLLSIEGTPPRKLIVAPTLEGEKIKSLLDFADNYGLTLARLPRLTDFKLGAVDKIPLRPIAVEDLLRRPQAMLDRKNMQKLIQNQVVLITGAGGTIGGELSRQVAGFNPKKLILLEHSEHNLYLIDKEMEGRFSLINRIPLIADIRDYKKINAIFKKERPDVVFHAAALKHVPLSEQNPEAAILTNIIGTRNIANACLKNNTKQMVMISTDKAVNPTSVMGMTKRIAESYIQALGLSSLSRKTAFITVRFGNVLGSTGSVVPLFRKQLEEGGPLTVTHKDMIRYFMTVREAVELVMQAAVMAAGEYKQSAIYVLEMGNPVKIEELALQMIRLAGLEPEKDIQITYTGIRPGEKLYEELFHPSESPLPTAHRSILLAAPRNVELKELELAIAALEKAATTGGKENLITLLRQFVPEYIEPEVNSHAQSKLSNAFKHT